MPIDPPTQVFGGNRFYEAPMWRMIVGDLDDNTLTFLDKLALDRSVTVTRAAARVISGRVPSDNPEVNIPTPDPDGEPFLSEGTRIVSCFRREAPGGGLSKVMKVDASAADAWAKYDLGAGYSDVWKTCRIAIPAASLTALATNLLTLLSNNSGYPGFGSFIDYIAYNGDNFWQDGNDAFADIVEVTTDEWHLCELHHVNGGASDLYIDGVLAASGTDPGGLGDTRLVLAGIAGVGGFPDLRYYVDDFKVGTTRGAGDLFHDDFESGTFDAWTETTGDVSIVDDPFGSPTSAAPWVIRARGLVLDLTDDADSDHATSTFTAYDPWKYLYRRPVLLADGSLPGDAGRVYPAGTTADEIIIEQLSIAEATGGTVFTDYDSTGFYTGTIETTDPLPDDGDGLAITFARGVTLGEMLDTLVATGTCDVVFDPIYDPDNRPGILCELSIYGKAGEFRPNAIFGWDKWPRNVVQLSRQIDGTGRANRIQMFAGQGGPPVPEQDDAASIAAFGEYWALQYLPGVPSIGAAKTIAQRQLALLKDGAYTYALSPAAERAPLLFEEYREADTLPLYASRRFRDPITGVPLRVESIPIVIGDDQLERVNQMLVSFSPETGS